MHAIWQDREVIGLWTTAAHVHEVTLVVAAEHGKTCVAMDTLDSDNEL